MGMDLWLIPTVNPDGDAHNTRYNAHRVDLNRNFPTSWVKQGTGTRYYSGPKAASEPETRTSVTSCSRSSRGARSRSTRPLNGVDTSTGKDPALAKDLAAWSGYPTKSFTCTTGCHGTMTQFINAKTPGAGSPSSSARRRPRLGSTRSSPR